MDLLNIFTMGFCWFPLTLSVLRLRQCSYLLFEMIIGREIMHGAAFRKMRAICFSLSLSLGKKMLFNSDEIVQTSAHTRACLPILYEEKVSAHNKEFNNKKTQKVFMMILYLENRFTCQFNGMHSVAQHSTLNAVRFECLPHDRTSSIVV